MTDTRSYPGSVEARFFIDHGMIHDRSTGKHVTTEPDSAFCDGIQRCCELLNALAEQRESKTFPLLFSSKWLEEKIKTDPDIECEAGPSLVITSSDPTASEQWNAGCDFAMEHLCKFLGVDFKDVSWDAATETVDGDVIAVIGNILRAKFGEDWSHGVAQPAGKPIPQDLARLIDGEAWIAIQDGRDARPGSMWSFRRDFALRKADAIISSWTDLCSLSSTKRETD